VILQRICSQQGIGFYLEDIDKAVKKHRAKLSSKDLAEIEGLKTQIKTYAAEGEDQPMSFAWDRVLIITHSAVALLAC
jgi:hypothetical protein